MEGGGYRRTFRCLVCDKRLPMWKRADLECDHPYCARCVERINRWAGGAEPPGERDCPSCGRQGSPPERDPPADHEPPSGDQALIQRRPVREDECPICATGRLGEVHRGRIHCCDHFFCFDCIKRGAEEALNFKCPQCRGLFHQIESDWPPYLQRTRAHNQEQSTVWDIPTQTWMALASNVAFTSREDPAFRGESCFLCHGRRGVMRRCTSMHCGAAFHIACGNPIWNRIYHFWGCERCIEPHLRIQQ